MTDIFKLIKVDFLKIYSAKTLFVMVFFVPFLIIFSKDFFSLPFIISIYAASFGILSYDEMYKSDYFYASLPVSRTKIVVAKYLFSILAAVYVALLTMAISYLDFVTVNQIVFNITLLFSFFFISVMTPLLLIVGATKGRYIGLGLYIVGILFITDNDLLLMYATAFDTLLSNTLLTVLLASILLLGSLLLSISLYKNKECKE